MSRIGHDPVRAWRELPSQLLDRPGDLGAAGVDRGGVGGESGHVAGDGLPAHSKAIRSASRSRCRGRRAAAQAGRAAGTEIRNPQRLRGASPRRRLETGGSQHRLAVVAARGRGRLGRIEEASVAIAPVRPLFPGASRNRRYSSSDHRRGSAGRRETPPAKSTSWSPRPGFPPPCSARFARARPATPWPGDR